MTNVKAERQNRRLLKTYGFDPARLTKAQIKRAGALLAIISRDICSDNRPDRKPAAIEELRELIGEMRGQPRAAR